MKKGEDGHTLSKGKHKKKSKKIRDIDWTKPLEEISQKNPSLIFNKETLLKAIQEGKTYSLEETLRSNQYIHPQERFYAIIMLIDKELNQLEEDGTYSRDSIEELLTLGIEIRDIKKEIIREWLFFTVKSLIKKGFNLALRLLYQTSITFTYRFIESFFYEYPELDIRDFPFVLDDLLNLTRKEALFEVRLKALSICSCLAFRLDDKTKSEELLRECIIIFERESLSKTADLAFAAAFTGEFKLADDIIQSSKWEDNAVVKGMALNLALHNNEEALIPLLNQITEPKDRVEILKALLKKKNDLAEIEELIDTFAPPAYKAELFLYFLELREDSESISFCMETLDGWSEFVLTLQSKVNIRCRIALLYLKLHEFTLASRILKDNIALIDKISFTPEQIRARCDQVYAQFRCGGFEAKQFSLIAEEIKLISYKPDFYRCLSYLIYCLTLTRKYKEAYNLFISSIRYNFNLNHLPSLINLLSTIAVYANMYEKEEVFIESMTYSYNLNKGLEYDLQRVRTYYYIASALIKAKRLEPAKDILKRIDSISLNIKDFNERKIIRVYKARLMAELGEWKFAFQEIEKINGSHFRNKAFMELEQLIEETGEIEAFYPIYKGTGYDSQRIEALHYFMYRLNDKPEIDRILQQSERLNPSHSSLVINAEIARRYVQIGYKTEGLKIFEDLISKSRELTASGGKSSSLAGIAKSMAESGFVDDATGLIGILERDLYYLMAIASIAAGYPTRSKERAGFIEEFRLGINSQVANHDLKDYQILIQALIEHDRTLSKELDDVLNEVILLSTTRNEEEGVLLRLYGDILSRTRRLSFVIKLDKEIAYALLPLLDFLSSDKMYFYHGVKDYIRMLSNIDGDLLLSFIKSFLTRFIPEIKSD